MRKAGIFVLFSALWLVAAQAQVSVEVRLEQEQYLPREKLFAAVRITNRSGQALQLGSMPDWLTFSVEGDGGVLPQLGAPEVEGEFTVDSGKVATKRVDIAPYFPLEKIGRYAVIANVKIPQWGADRTSAPRGFDIIEGARIWHQEFGLPKSVSGDTDAPEVRRYILEQANYLRGQIRLYVRVTDDTGLKTFRVTPVGKMLSFSRPEAQIDSYANLHLIYQNGPRVFSYTKYNAEGDLLARQTYDYIDTRPRLQVNLDREIGVKGGSRRNVSTDIPTPSLDAAAEGTAIGGTNAPPEASAAAPASPEDSKAAKKKSKRDGKTNG